MEKINNSGNESEETKDETTEQEGVDSTNNDVDNSDDKGDAGADDKGETGDDSKGDDTGDDGGNTDDDKKSDKTNPDVDEEPKTRKRNIDFILDRKDKKIAKLKERSSRKEDNNDDTDDNDDGVNPEDKEIIGGVVKELLKPIIDKQVKDEDEADIKSFLSDNPEFKPYADKVRKFSQHESRRNIPIESIFYEVAGKDLMKLGADKARKSDKEARDSGTGGGSNRGGSGSGSKPVSEMTQEEFQAEQDRVRFATKE